MAETNNSKNVFKDLSVDKILTIVSITLSVVAIVISIVAISKSPSNCFAPSFSKQGQIWDATTNATRPNPFGQAFGQKGKKNDQNKQGNGFGKLPNNQNDANRNNGKNQNGPTANNSTNIDPGNTTNNNPKFDGFRQNNYY